MPSDDLFAIKMRAAQRSRHISGAERIVPRAQLPHFANALIQRALHHANGEPDEIHLKLQQLEPAAVRRLTALPVSQRFFPQVAEARAELAQLLRSEGFGHADELVAMLLEQAPGMRGAMLVHADTLERLEPDHARGVRATNMDDAQSAARPPEAAKNHFHEAVVLATKVANAPGMLCELCISDDPEYTTGYYASRTAGYVRLGPLKQPGDPRGGRLFLWRGTPAELPATLDYLENQPVLVENCPASVPGSVPAHSCAGEKHLAQNLAELEKSHLLRHCLPLDTPADTWVQAGTEKLLMLASNNYLGLANHPRVKAAAAAAIQRWGVGAGGARLTSGDTTLHEELETALAHFKGTDAALLFNTGYMANVGAITALCDARSVIFSDELNHASIIDGCRLSRARIVIYRHNDLADLEAKLRANPAASGLIVSDAVFSMDGDLADAPAIVELARRHGFFSMLDEAHATGVVGDRGHGILEHFGLDTPPDVLMGTLSKALGAEGGYVCGSRTLVEYLRNHARSFIFTTACAPAIAAAAMEALQVLQDEPELPRRLRENVEIFCNTLRENGIGCTTPPAAIIPILVGDEARALAVAEHLRQHGIFLSAIRYPTVAKGQARLRVSLMATHAPDDLRHAAQTIADALHKIP